MNKISPAAEKRGRRLYIVESAVEYLIALLVEDSFLATVTKQIGMPDSLTGILSSIISFGCLFQLLSVFIRPKRDKWLVIAFSILNQLLFMMLYLIPLFNISTGVRIALFFVCIILAYFFYYLVHPKKTNWFMSLVEDRHRGSFTANKEIVSLLSGMGFSFAMGTITDYFADTGRLKVAFAISAVVILTLTVSHTLTMVFIPGTTVEEPRKKNLLACFKEVLGNKSVLSITGVFLLYYVSRYISTPFYSTYMIGELGFNLKFVSALAVFGSIVRILVAKLLGNYADKRSFAAMIEICFASLIAAYLCAGFAMPSNGKIMFILHRIFSSVAMGGINSALTNMIFDYVPNDKRSDSLAVCQAISGLFGFLATLCASIFVDKIQSNGNAVFGIPVYAQQVMSFVSVGITIVAIVYVKKIVMKKTR